MRIIKLAPAERKIVCRFARFKSDEFRADWEAYQESAGDGAATLGITSGTGNSEILNWNGELGIRTNS